MLHRRFLGLVVAFLLALAVPAGAAAQTSCEESGSGDMNGQEDQQNHEDHQEQLSANNTAFRGARLLERGSQAYVGNVSAPDEGQSASVFWTGDTLNMEVRSDESGNQVAVKVEFFWFEAGKDRNSDFYVAIIRGNSSPKPGTDCLDGEIDTEWGDTPWQLGVDQLAQFVHAKADTSGQGGSIRWDWSIPFQTYRWEPKQNVNIQQHYALNAGATAEGAVEGSAGMSSSPTADTGGDAPTGEDACSDSTGSSSNDSDGSFERDPDGEQIQAKGSISGEGTVSASHEVSTNYSVTLYRWELKVSSGPSGIKWGMVPLDPKKATDNGYHEYYLVMQSESKGQPMVIPELEFGGNFECPRYSILPDKDEKLEATAKNIRLTPPPLPDCGENERISGDECVPKCPDGEVYKNGNCEPEQDDGSCQSDDECSNGKICDGGNCVQPNCMISDECGRDEICERGRCRAVECSRDADCASGEECASDGTCIRPTDNDSDDDSDGERREPSSPDAGVSPDAGSRSGNSSGRMFNGTACSLARPSPTGFPSTGWMVVLLIGIVGWVRSRNRS